MGIFSADMPLLYGERIRAFGRLQEEITKNSGDQNLFAWESPGRPGFLPNFDTIGYVGFYKTRSVSASHPTKSAVSGSIRGSPGRDESYTLINKGVSIMIPLKLPGLFSTVLDCMKCLEEREPGAQNHAGSCGIIRSPLQRSPSCASITPLVSLCSVPRG